MLSTVQSLRAFAAYAVVLFHWNSGINSQTSFNLPGAQLGSAGVDLFFVISGFIMVHVAGRRGGPGAFLFDRFARIAPLYWLALLALLVLKTVRSWMFEGADLSPGSVLSAFLFTPAFDLRGLLMPPLEVGWTLNFEMMFYVLFALSMFAAPKWRLPTLLGLMVLVFAAGTAAPDASIFSFYGSTLLFEFAAGCVLGWLVSNDKYFAPLKRLPGWIYIATGMSIFLATSTVVAPVDDRFLRWGIPATLIVLGAIILDLSRTTPVKGLLPTLGDHSYSAYLLHPFVVVVGQLLVLPLIGESTVLIALTYPLIMAATAVISMLSYKGIEIPSRNLLRRLRPANRPTAAAKAS